MGLFDMFKKKTSESKDSALKEFERDLIQTVALSMSELKITKQPALQFFYNDQGIFEGIFISRTTDPQFLEIAREDFYTYLLVLGCHSLGASAYVTMCQPKYKKNVSEFEEAEMQEIAQAFCDTDAYELAIKTLGFNPDGNNKKCLDHIVSTATDTALKLAGKNMKDKEYQKVYMRRYRLPT